MHGRNIFFGFDQCLHYFLILLFLVIFGFCLFIPVDARFHIRRINALSYNFLHVNQLKYAQLEKI